MEMKSTNLMNYKAKLTEQTKKWQAQNFIKLNDYITKDEKPQNTKKDDSVVFLKLLDKVLQRKEEAVKQKTFDELIK